MKKSFKILSIFAAFVAALFIGDAHGLAMATGLVSFAGGAPGLSDKQQIEMMASNFSQYEENFGGSDERLPKPKGVFTFKISSTATADRDFYIWSGYQLDAFAFSSSFGAAQTSRYGQMVDGVFRAIGQTGSGELTGASSPYGINEFLAYCKNIQGNKVTRIVVRSAADSVHTGEINIMKKDPLNQLGDRRINISVHRNPMALIQTTTIINDGFTLGRQDFVKMTIPAGVTDLTVELYMNGYSSF